MISFVPKDARSRKRMVRILLMEGLFLAIGCTASGAYLARMGRADSLSILLAAIATVVLAILGGWGTALVSKD